MWHFSALTMHPWELRCSQGNIPMSLLGDPIPDYFFCLWINCIYGFWFFSWGVHKNRTFILYAPLQSELAFHLSRKCAPNLMVLPRKSLNYLMPCLVVISYGNDPQRFTFFNKKGRVCCTKCGLSFQVHL